MTARGMRRLALALALAAAGISLWLLAASGSLRGEAESLRRAAGYPESWRGR